MTTIRLGAARVLLSSWEVTAFVSEDGPSAEDLRNDPHGHLVWAARKGDVAHFRVPIESVRRGSESAPVGVVVFPAFQSGASVSVQRLGKATAFLKLAGNAFNYEVVGARGFRAVTSIIRHCESYILQYGDLAEAHAAIDEIMSRGAPQ